MDLLQTGDCQLCLALLWEHSRQVGLTACIICRKQVIRITIIIMSPVSYLVTVVAAFIPHAIALSNVEGNNRIEMNVA